MAKAKLQKADEITNVFFLQALNSPLNFNYKNKKIVTVVSNKDIMTTINDEIKGDLPVKP